MAWDDEGAPVAPAPVIGQDLSRHSVDELEALIARLEAEIVRVRDLITSKSAQRGAADALFGPKGPPHTG